jgi:hypothetical protein
MKIGLMLLVFICGVLAGDGLCRRSNFPTAHGNFIASKAPRSLDGEKENDSPANVAHLGLIHDMSLFRKHTWTYRLQVTDRQGGLIERIEFKPEEVGGRFQLEHSAALVWDDDGQAVTARIGEFVCRHELPKNSS